MDREQGLAHADTVRGSGLVIPADGQFSCEPMMVKENRLRDVFYSAPLGIGITRMSDQRFVEANPAFLALFDYPLNQIKRLNWLELVHPLDHEQSRARLQQLLKGTRSSVRVDERYLTRGGREWLGRKTLTLMCDEAGKPEFILGMVEDITSRRAAQDELQRRHCEQQAILELGKMALGGMIVDELFNRAMDLVLGAFSADKVAITFQQPDGMFLLKKGCGWMEGLVGTATFHGGNSSQAGYTVLENQPVVVRDYLKESRFQYSDFLRSHDVLSGLTVVIRCRGGGLGTLGVYSKKRRCFALEQGAFLQSLADILAQAIDREKALEALRSAESQYRHIFDHSMEPIFQMGMDGNLMLVNPAFANLFGYEDAMHIRGGFRDFPGEHFVNPGVYLKLSEELLNVGVVHDAEIEMYRCDRSRLRVLFNARVVCDEKGGVMHYEGTLTDITERRRLEEQLHQAQKMEAVGRLAGGVAHDFNNILTVINGYCEMMATREDVNEEIRSSLDEIQKAGLRAADLTKQLLAFSRKQKMEPKVLDVNKVITGIRKMLSRIIGEDVHFATALMDGPLPFKADPGQMEQVLMNLSINARDAMPNGGCLVLGSRKLVLSQPVGLQTGIMPAGVYHGFWLMDSGSGMSPETLSRIYEPFFSTKGDRGTGLGLSTVYGIVQQTGGYITVTSRLGVGTTFAIYFPRAVEEVLPEVTVKSLAKPNVEGQTILLVEDENEVRSFLMQVLMAIGFRVLAASNGREALEMFESNGGMVDLVITDMVMPEMNGRQLIQTLCSRKPGLRVLLMSGYLEDVLRRDLDGNDIAPFIQKPFSPQELARTLDQILNVSASG